MKKHVMLLGSAVLLVGSVLVSGQTPVHATPDAAQGGTLIIGLSQTFQFLDPRFAKSNYDRIVVNNIFDPLFMLDPETLEPCPYVAKSWEVLNDGAEIVFHLNEGIRFHNGEPLTAEDVAFTFNWIADPSNGSPNQLEFDWLEKVVVVDDYTCKFVVKKDRVPFPALFAGETWSIVPKDTVLEMGDEAFANHPIGSGPFKFVEWKTGDRIVLERNEDYWLVKPNLGRVIFRPIPELATMMAELEAGGIDIADTVPAEDVPRFRAMDNVEIQQTAGVLYFYLAFNHSHLPGSDYRFRRAVAQAVDWDGAIFSIFKGITGQRIYGALAPTIWANDQEGLRQCVWSGVPYDPDAAHKLLAELKAEGVFPKDRPVRILTPLDPRRVRIGEIVVTALKQNGIKAEVRPLDWGPLLDTLYRSEDDPTGSTFDMYIIGQGVGPDPYYYLNFLFHSKQAVVGAPNNKSWYSNPAVDLLLDAAASTFDQDLREKFYVAAQRLIFLDIAHIPLYTYVETQGVSTRVHGYRISPISSRMDLCTPFTNVWVEP